MDRDEDVRFTVKGYTSPTDIPTWARRPPKWHELMDVIRDLQPGQTLIIEFPSKEVANRARNVVRDELNAELGRAAIRTRLVGKKAVEGGPTPPADVYFTRLNPIDIETSQDE